MIVRFVETDATVDRHCLNFLFIIIINIKQQMVYGKDNNEARAF
jgi:hypothetical protein